MSGSIRDLHRNHYDKYLTEVRTSADHLFESNSYCVKIERPDDEVEVESETKLKNGKLKLIDVGIVRRGIKRVWKDGKVPKVKIHYPLIHNSNRSPHHFIEGYTEYLEDILGIRIRDRIMKGHIELSEDEKSWSSQIQEMTGRDDYYWIVVNGGKMDCTAKWWDPIRMQRVVSSLKEILFVQVGVKDKKNKNHCHFPLHGDNVIDLVGKTDLRELIRLVYNSSGVICPVTALMHLAAAVPTRYEKCYERESRPCVVLAGGRESSSWEAYATHAYLHSCGMLKCCDEGGCWKARIEPIGDGSDNDNSICKQPSTTENGIVIPKCLAMIGVNDVIRAVKNYLP
jgi:hypothetical protein